MVPKIKAFIKKIIQIIQELYLLACGLWDRVARKLRSCEKIKQAFQSVKVFAARILETMIAWWKKLWQFVKSLWMTSENRLLLILIGAVVVLLTAVLIFFLNFRLGERVGICYRDDTDISNTYYRQILEQTLSKRGYEVIVTHGENSADVQHSQLQELADRRCRVIIAEPVSDKDSVAAALAELEIPGVILTAGDAAQADSVIYTPADDAISGKIQAEMAQQLPNGGDINGDGVLSYIVLQGTQNPSASARIAFSFQDTMEANGISCHHLNTEYAEGTQDGGKQLCADALAIYGKDVELILCSSDTLTAGAVQAVADGGRQNGQDVYILGVAEGTTVLQLVRDGRVSGMVYADPVARTQTVAKAVSALLRNTGDLDSSQTHIPITADNIDQYFPEE